MSFNTITERLVRDLTAIASDAFADATGAAVVRPAPALMPTPRDVIAREGTASLYRFVGTGPRRGRPVLLVPSLINQWYVLDLRAGASLVSALVDAGLDVWCLDWGAPEDEDRYRTWDDTLARLDRMVRRTLRTAGASQLALLGYCMGGTLATIYTALEATAILCDRSLVSLIPAQIAILVSTRPHTAFARAGETRTSDTSEVPPPISTISTISSACTVSS